METLPADLPENWTLEQIISPGGIEAGLTMQHGYNYLMQQVNATQRGFNTAQADIEELKSKESDGKRTVRFVIGTSTNGWTAADCDYLCDGVDYRDNQKLIDAIRALPATGGEIVILDGVYNFGPDTISIIKDNVTIRGSGGRATQINVRPWSSGSTVFFGISSNNVTIQDLYFVDVAPVEGTGRFSSSFIIQNTADNITIKNNIIDGNFRFDNAIKVTTEGRVNIINNHIEKITGDIIDIGRYIPYSKISQNYITNGQGRGIYIHSNYSSSLYLEISNNIINTLDSDAIYLGAEGSIASDGCWVFGNYIANIPTGNGISINNGSYIVSNNVIKGVRTGINTQEAVSSTIITGNTCNSNSQYGIYLVNSDSNTITGNICSLNALHGIYMYGGGNNTITGNTCNNNTNRGIFLGASNNNTITSNTCNDNAVGIYLSASNNNTITGNTCIRGSGTAANYTSGQYTIRLNSINNNNNLIAYNNIMGKNYVSGGGTGNTFAGNKY